MEQVLLRYTHSWVVARTLAGSLQRQVTYTTIWQHVHEPDSGMTEVDSLSLEYVSRNVRQNNLAERISVVQTDPQGPILAALTRRFDQHLSLARASGEIYSL